MTSVYVLTRGLSFEKMYKVGSHTGDKEKLIKRYITACPDLNILYSKRYPTCDYA